MMRFCSLSLLPRRAALVGLGFLVMLLALARPAQATGEAGIVVAPGALSGGALVFGDAPRVLLDGRAQRTTATWTMASVTDARGNGAGWSVRLTLTSLREYDLEASQYVAGGRVLGPASLVVATPPTAVVLDPTSSPAEAITLVPAGTALDTGQAVALVTAGSGAGMGSYTFGPLEVALTVPASASASAYAADALVSLSTSP